MKKHKWTVRKSGFECDKDPRTNGTYNYIIFCPECMSQTIGRFEIGTSHEKLKIMAELTFGEDCEEALKQNMMERIIGKQITWKKSSKGTGRTHLKRSVVRKKRSRYYKGNTM